ncbi:hypothetical protein Tco_1038871 [Tanacetum coccineum]
MINHGSQGCIQTEGGWFNAIDADEDITLVNVQDDADNEMFDVNALNGEEVFVAGQNENVVEEVVDVVQVSTAATTVTITTEEITLAQALEALKTSKPKVKGIVFQEPGKSTTITTISSQQSQDKGKGIMIEEPVKPMKKKVQIMLDEEVALKLQAKFDEEERLAREKVEKEKEANIAFIEEWNDIQVKIDADYQLAERLQADEQEELSVEEEREKSKFIFKQLLGKKERKRKSTFFAAKSVEENRNKPPTQAQQRKIMCTYLKNMKGKKPKDLKNKSFDSIQKMFDRSFKRQNVDEDKDTIELQSLMEVIPDKEEVSTDVVPLVTKSPKIVDWKIHKEGKKSYYQIVRADGKSQMYMIFSQMLKSFDREDLKDLYKLRRLPLWRKESAWDTKVLEWKLLMTTVEYSPVDAGRIVRIKSLLNAASITAAHIRVNAAQLEDMNQDSAHMVVASKVPMLKSGEFDLWRMMIKQYIQMIDYALWEVIENGATLPKTQMVEGVMIVMPITSA